MPWVNELEWVDGLLYANVWTTECIAQVDPATGRVVAWVWMRGLRASLGANALLTADVLNGIAWDGQGRRLFVTGKLWPRVFQVEFVAGGTPPLSMVRAACIPLGGDLRRAS